MHIIIIFITYLLHRITETDNVMTTATVITIITTITTMTVVTIDRPTDVYVKVGKLPLFYHGKILRDFSLGLIMGRFYVISAMS